jgi:predicted transcriptional regulator
MKEELISRIKQTSDTKMLQDLLRLIEHGIEEIYSLSDEQKIAVKEAQNEISKGNFFTNEDINNEIDEWLKK